MSSIFAPGKECELTTEVFESFLPLMCLVIESPITATRRFGCLDFSGCFSLLLIGDVWILESCLGCSGLVCRVFFFLTTVHSRSFGSHALCLLLSDCSFVMVLSRLSRSASSWATFSLKASHEVHDTGTGWSFAPFKSWVAVAFFSNYESFSHNFPISSVFS